MADVIIVMGVSGVGKTTIGKALAAALHADFAEGDDYHPASNVEKMRQGQPLTDEDRQPWLDRLRTAIETWLTQDRKVVLACSALKASYRDRLMPKEGEVQFLYLRAGFDDVAERLAQRKGHYMPASLLQSQFETLEPPEDAITVNADQPAEDIIAELRRLLLPAKK